MGQVSAEEAARISAVPHSSAGAAGASSGPTAPAPQAPSVVISAARGCSRPRSARSRRPTDSAASAYTAPIALARIRFCAGEKPYRLAVTKKIPAQKAPPLIDPRNVVASTAASGAGRSSAAIPPDSAGRAGEDKAREDYPNTGGRDEGSRRWQVAHWPRAPARAARAPRGPRAD